MNPTRFSVFSMLLAGTSLLSAGLPTKPILYVTQVPVLNENKDAGHVVAQMRMNAGSVFGNHLGDTASAPRGGALMIRYADAPGTIKNLTSSLGYVAAVRSPCVDWTGTKALFSMVSGLPASAADATPFYWQIYEITNFAQGQTPVITKLPGQPASANNIHPVYGTDGRVLFVSDRIRDGSSHLYPQLDEYLDLPTPTGIWTIDPAIPGGDLKILTHTPSGAFSPQIDSFGRVIFVRWDHLARDPAAVYDRGPLAGDTFTEHTANGTFNYASELAGSAQSPASQFFPEPRNFDRSGIAAEGGNFNGQAFNIFSPWMMLEDGTGEEFVNHAGRHELYAGIKKSFLDDPNLIDLAIGARNFYSNFVQVRESGSVPGRYFGIDTQEDATHASGQIISIDAGPAVNPEAMAVTYVTAKLPFFAGPTGGNAVVYRNPLPMSDGNLVAVSTSVTGTDANTGTATQPLSAYAFRLKSLKLQGSLWVPDQVLTGAGQTGNVTYYAAGQQMTYNGPLWELDPVEVTARNKPAKLLPQVTGVEAGVISGHQVDVALLQQWMRQQGLALIVSRNVTTRDDIDKQQPFNLQVAGTATKTIGAAGKVYDIADLQLLQADQLRGLTTVPGRRVLPVPMHDDSGENVPNPGGPAGSVKLGTDGSLAAFVPANRALTWHLTAPDHSSVVKERYWVTFQPGEIRTCTSCHGLNNTDQAGHTAPVNPPQALATLLDYWKPKHPWESWKSAKFGAQATTAAADEGSDPDNDGESNLAEFAFATNPQAVDAPVVSVSETAGVTTMVYHRRKGTDATFHHELSTDLTNWDEASPYVQADTPADDGNGVTESVTLHVSTLPPGATRAFLRARATRP
jgi:hypothetical protein